MTTHETCEETAIPGLGHRPPFGLLGFLVSENFPVSDGVGCGGKGFLSFPCRLTITSATLQSRTFWMLCVLLHTTIRLFYLYFYIVYYTLLRQELSDLTAAKKNRRKICDAGTNTNSGMAPALPPPHPPPTPQPPSPTPLPPPPARQQQQP